MFLAQVFLSPFICRCFQFLDFTPALNIERRWNICERKIIGRLEEMRDELSEHRMAYIQSNTFTSASVCWSSAMNSLNTAREWTFMSCTFCVVSLIVSLRIILMPENTLINLHFIKPSRSIHLLERHYYEIVLLSYYTSPHIICCIRKRICLKPHLHEWNETGLCCVHMMRWCAFAFSFKTDVRFWTQQSLKYFAR